MKNKKGNVAVIAIIIVIVAITAGIVGYLFAKKTQAPVVAPVVTPPAVQTPVVQPTTQPITPVDETANWQTYTNAKYGIEFKYPKYLQFDGSEVPDISAGSLYAITANYNNGDGDSSFHFIINDKEFGSGSDQVIDEVTSSLGKNMHIKKEITIPTGKITLSDGVMESPNSYFMDAFFKGNNYNYTFDVSMPKYSEQMLSVFEKMMATAKLTK